MYLLDRPPIAAILSILVSAWQLLDRLKKSLLFSQSRIAETDMDINYPRLRLSLAGDNAALPSLSSFVSSLVTPL
jgi:hypothetical protein